MDAADPRLAWINGSKMWILDPVGGAWLRKEAHPLKQYELAIEAFCLRLAAAFGLPTPEAHLSTWLDASGKQRRAILVRNFLRATPGDPQSQRASVKIDGATTFALMPDGAFATSQPHEELASGAEVLEGTFPTYVRGDHSQHTLAATVVSLARMQRLYDTDGMVASMMRLLFFDAWIGYGDRHQENWGVIFSTHAAPRLAPIYDPAASLGAELQPNHALLDASRRSPERVAKYVDNCSTGFGDNNGNLVKQPVLVGEMTQWPDWKAYSPTWLAAIDRIRDTKVHSLLAQIPDEWFPPWRKQLAVLLLRQRYEWLKGYL